MVLIDVLIQNLTTSSSKMNVITHILYEKTCDFPKAASKLWLGFEKPLFGEPILDAEFSLRLGVFNSI